MKKEFKAWEKEKKLIPLMIKKYCNGKHKPSRKKEGVNRNNLCLECTELTEYALFRLDKCPFKANKKFCSFCKIHCYKPEMSERIKEVMKYSGPRMLLSHPIFALKHVFQMIRYKKSIKKDKQEN